MGSSPRYDRTAVFPLTQTTRHWRCPVLKMTKELDQVFEAKDCNEKTLTPKITHLVNLAAHLASHNAKAAHRSYTLAGSAGGASVVERHRAACLAACAAGPRVHDTYAGFVPEATKGAGATYDAAEAAATLTASPFFNLCKEDSLDAKTTHLVSLAACLVTRCACAEGCIVQARNAGATDAELVRVACLTAEAAGMHTKYAFLEAREAVKGVTDCVC
jgi:alkylhydroperoxidase/carboxymuconolactone decarboxylase family protein YurZ